MIFRRELTYYEIEKKHDVKKIDGEYTGFTFLRGIYEIIDINSMVKSLLPDDVEVKITIDDTRLISNLTNNETIKFAKKSFFYTILRFIQSHSGPLGGIDGYIQLIAGTYKSDKPISITGIDKVHLNLS